MRIKRYIGGLCTRAYDHIRSQGIWGAVPLVALDLLLPGLHYLTYVRYGVGEELYANILQYSQWLMPLMSVWWPLFALREYLEGQGNELLYVNRYRCKLPDLLALFLPAAGNTALLFLAYACLFPAMRYEFLRILSIEVLYLGVVYFVGFLTKSMGIPLMALLLYTVGNIYCGLYEMTGSLWYFSSAHWSGELYLTGYLPKAGVGAAGLLGGVFLNRRRLPLGS